MQNDLTFNPTFSKDRPIFEMTCMTAGVSDHIHSGNIVDLFFNGIVGRLHISADSYIHFL